MIKTFYAPYAIAPEVKQLCFEHSVHHHREPAEVHSMTTVRFELEFDNQSQIMAFDIDYQELYDAWLESLTPKHKSIFDQILDFLK